MPEPSDRERIADLEAAGRVQDQRLSDIEAGAIVLDERIVELVREIDGLHGKIEHRATIEQAKGIIMHTLDCSSEAAFAALVARSQAENRKLRDLAQEIIETQHPSSGSAP